MRKAQSEMSLVVIITIIAAITVGFSIRAKMDKAYQKQIFDWGYNVYDVKVFCEKVDASFEDFVKSPSIKKQYAIFADGNVSEFIQVAEAKKKADEEKNSGMATGMVVGVAAGMASSSR